MTLTVETVRGATNNAMRCVERCIPRVKDAA